MDFIHDPLEVGRNCRLFNVIDDYNRECHGIEVDLSMPSERVVRVSGPDYRVAGKAPPDPQALWPGIYQCHPGYLG